MTAPEPPDDGRPMSPEVRWWLLVYLLGISVLVVYALLRLNTMDFPDVALGVDAPRVSVRPAAGDTQSTTEKPADGQKPAGGEKPGEKPAGDAQRPVAPALTDAFSYLRPGSVPQYEIALYGSGFHERSQVRVNGERRMPLAPPEANLIRVVPTSSDLVGRDSLLIEVVNPPPEGANTPAAVSNALALRLDRPRRTLRLLYLEWTISREMQLVLMVLFAGALGSLVHGVKSLTDFIGNRTAITSWAAWYVARPFLGGAMAFIVYAVFRGGFLTGTPGEAGVVNPFGVTAIAALVGMFTDKAAQKLAEVFDTLFKADDRRSGKLAAPVISRIEPPTVLTGTTDTVDLKIIGERLSATRTVTIDGKERTPDKVSDKEVVVKLQPEDMARSGEFSISVVTAEATSPSVKFFVSDLTIKAEPLKPGKAGDPYSDTVAATGGKQPLKWSLNRGPSWLKIDATSGVLSGKPAATGTFKPTVTVTDSVGASVSKEFELKIDP